MKYHAILAFIGSLILGGCGANLKPVDLGPDAYLVLRAHKGDHTTVAALKEAAVSQATAGCQQAHQVIRVFDVPEGGPPHTDFSDQGLAIQALEANDARTVTVVHVHFRCVSEREAKS